MIDLEGHRARVDRANKELGLEFQRAMKGVLNDTLRRNGEPLLPNRSLVAAFNNPQSFQSILELWRAQLDKRVIPSVLSVYRRSAAEFLRTIPDLREQLAALNPQYLSSLRNIRADAFLARLTPSLAGLGEEAFRAATTALHAALDQGLGAARAAELIRESFQTSVSSSVRTARTLATSVVNGADYDVTQELAEVGLVTAREWFATGDGRTRPEHAEADGQVRPVGEPFDVGGEALDYPGDPAGSTENTTNCRCVTLLVEAP